jgi:hypothetical protein
MRRGRCCWSCGIRTTSATLSRDSELTSSRLSSRLSPTSGDEANGFEGGDCCRMSPSRRPRYCLLPGPRRRSRVSSRQAVSKTKTLTRNPAKGV